MPLINTTLPALTIAVLYCLWNAHHLRFLQQRQALVRERVAYMLWVAAGLTQ